MTSTTKKGRDMSDELKWFFGVLIIPFTWLIRLIWQNHTELQSIKDNHPTWENMHHEIRNCSDDKDRAINDLKEDTRYIRDKLDKLIDLHVSRRE